MKGIISASMLTIRSRHFIKLMFSITTYLNIEGEEIGVKIHDCYDFIITIFSFCVRECLSHCRIPQTICVNVFICMVYEISYGVKDLFVVLSMHVR